MYVKIPYTNPKPLTKVQAIRYLKSHKAWRDFSNAPGMVKYIQGRHKLYSVQQYKKTGVYLPSYPEGDLLNIDNEFQGNIEEYPELLSGNSYGVCDNPENFLEVYNKELDGSDRKFFVTLTPILKADQSEYGGWRWHKWGPYIGKHKPKHEYLYDEEEIDKIYIFSVFEVLN